MTQIKLKDFQMQTLEKYARFAPFVLSYLVENVVDCFDNLKSIPPQLFMFKNSSNEDYAIFHIASDLLSQTTPESWHTIVKSIYHLGFKNDAEGYIVVVPTKDSNNNICLLYTLFNVQLQEGTCFAHSLSSEDTIELHRADCSGLGDAVELLFTPQH